MSSIDLSNNTITKHVATLLDDLITWRAIGSKQSGRKFLTKESFLFKSLDPRETTNIQPHGGAWMPADRSFDRILFWLLSKELIQKQISLEFFFRRTVENNSFQLFEYSMTRNLQHNALQIQFGVPTTVLPNVFIVELPDRQQICLMFVTHIGIYRWILKTSNN